MVGQPGGVGLGEAVSTLDSTLYSLFFIAAFWCALQALRLVQQVCGDPVIGSGVWLLDG